MVKARGSDDSWVRAEYERLMGSQALARQTPIRDAKGNPADACNCGWKNERAFVVGPHHGQACPMFTVEPDEGQK